MALARSTTEVSATDQEYISTSDNSGYQLINIIAKRLLLEKYAYLTEDLIPILLDCTDCRSYDCLAQDLIPNEYTINPTVAKKIIHLAVQSATQKYNSQLPEGAELIDLDSRTSRVKSTTNVARRSGQVMLEAMGRQPYSFEELCFVVSLTQNSEYIWNTTSNVGRPNWNKIAIALNYEFGTKRTAQSIMDQIKSMRHQNDERLIKVYEYLQAQQVEEATEDDVFYIDKFIQKIILEKEIYERFGIQIAAILNDLNDVRSYLDIVRDLMPEEYAYGENAANQIISTLVDLIRFDPNINFSEDLFEKRKIIITTNRNRRSALANNMLENQGVTRFTRDEFYRFMELRRECIREDGPQVGRTDYLLVAQILNDEFHSGAIIRTGDKLSSLIRAYRKNFKKKPYIYPPMDDFSIPVDNIVNAYFLPEQ